MEAALPYLPHRRLLWSQYATLLVQRVACDAYHRRRANTAAADNAQWAPLCGWEHYYDQGNQCDCRAHVAQNVARLFGATEPRPLGAPPAAGAAVRPSHRSVVDQFFALGGFVDGGGRSRGHATWIEWLAAWVAGPTRHVRLA